ncbi:MAG: M48 family metallopeptidase [Bacilli bacterium]|nr:M48 family metallopeptidase [Bacilli bacterium]MBN2876188.1 M48 family metallopeptidase [Bacilli bacterium]
MNIVIIAIIFVMLVFNLFIAFLNLNHSKQPIPVNVQHIYNEEEYTRWLSYYTERTRFGVIQKAVSTAVILILLLLKVFVWFQDIAASITGVEVLQTVLFIIMYILLSSVIEIPFAYYSTFKIEEKYGFNKSTKKLFVIDMIKNFLLMSFLFGALVAGLHGLFLLFTNIWIFVLSAWIFVSLIMVLMFILNTTIFVKTFNKLTPLEPGSLKDKIDALAKKVGFEVDKISIMDGSKRSTKLNAFFSGLGKKRDVVLFDTLVEKLSEEEVVAVLAHELGHALDKDTLKMLLGRIVTFGLYALVIGYLLQNQQVYLDFGFSAIVFGFGIVLFMILMEPLELILGFPLNYSSRKMEYAADKFASEQMSKEDIVHALEIVAKENFSNLNPHPFYVKMVYNHPTTSERFKAIMEE